MTRFLFLLIGVMLSVSVRAQVCDAFHGILPVTDPAMMRSLNGRWNIKVVKGIDDGIKAVPQADHTWRDIPVPGCWEAYGLCRPLYNRPDSLTGYYRMSFAVPGEWKGKRIVVRFDGVLYGYDLWINDSLAGSWQSGYNTALFDITPFIDKGKKQQQLAMRVYSRFDGSDFDCNDDWAPNGIFRDVTLMAVPEVHLKDLTIFTRNTGEVDVKTDVANAGKKTRVMNEILDSKGNVVGSNRVDNPNLWTAETPYLYTLRTRLYDGKRLLQTFCHKFGFRELTVDGNILKLNGRPVKLRGVTCHSTDPKTVKVVSEELTLKDMRLMKEASVNYIRTSHYPREPRFYELADSLGFYVIDEVPFGFGDKNLSDSTFYPVLQQRAQATVRRDKNHPSVLIWSLGNENPLTDICIHLGGYVKKSLDPSRPVCYPQVGSYFRRFNYKFPEVADIYTPHYPTTSQIGSFYQKADRPVIFTEYCHSLGISFEDHDRQWEIIENTPCIAGGSVWEWVDQGMPFKDKASEYGYEERVFTSKEGGFEMYGNKGTDGLLYADRTPLPNYYELQHNYARAFLSNMKYENNSVSFTINNRYDFINLRDNVTFNWSLTENRDTVMKGSFSPDCAPRDSICHSLRVPHVDGFSLLNIEVKDKSGCCFLNQSFVLKRAAAEWSGNCYAMKHIQEGPLVRVGRKPTMAENLKLAGQRIERYLQPANNPYVKQEINLSEDGNAVTVDYRLTPDTTDKVLTELGVAFLLDSSIDRVQWIGYGPFAGYPGRHQANRYGVWAKRAGDLYFEGNRIGVDAAFFSDAEGNGILIAGDSLDINFEQTDRGIVMTVNAAVSGQGPKFARTHFPVVSRDVGTVSGKFRMYGIEAGGKLHSIEKIFYNPNKVNFSFSPFVTQYDTYLLRFDQIRGEGSSDF